MTFALVGGRSKSFRKRRTVRSVSAEPHRHGRSGLDLWFLHQPMIPRSRIVGRGDRAGLLLQESDVKLDVYEHSRKSMLGSISLRCLDPASTGTRDRLGGAEDETGRVRKSAAD